MPSDPPHCHAVGESEPMSSPWQAGRAPRSFSLEMALGKLGGFPTPEPPPPREPRGPEKQGAGQKAPVLKEGPQEPGSPPSVGTGLSPLE